MPEIIPEVTSIVLRGLEKKDYKDLKESMIEAYAGIGGSYWNQKKIDKLLDLFPEGQFCVEVNGKVVACALAIIVDYKKHTDYHTYQSITGNFTFSTHTPKGDVLYGIDVFVHPEYRGLRLGRRMYDARKELCEQLNLRAIVAGGRIPNYKQYAGKLKPRQYIEKVRFKEIYDPTLSFQLSNDFHVKKIITGYLEGDTESHEYATLLEWSNIYYREDVRSVSPAGAIVRIGLVQWEMRPMPDMNALLEQAEFFVDVVSGYQCDFILFPELFNAPLMADYNHLGEAEAIRELAGFTRDIRDRFIDFAVTYNVNIITGGMPYVERGKLKNISYLCHRDGTCDAYSKIHPTPNEIKSWGMSGGNKLKAFNTDCGKIGILICYDVEFPELSRLYADQGVQILFVPFNTDNQNGYTRVRSCAQARAIENECYVVIAGCVGNLPRVNNMDIQYAQSAIFTPSDFPFPTNSVKAEATPNTEMTLIADVDLNSLKELHEYGTVRTLKDRRNDLYEVKWKGK